MRKRTTLPPPANRVLLSLSVPIIGAVVLGGLVGLLFGGPGVADPTGRAGTAILLAGIGIISLVMGVRWYGLRGMSLRGHRPLYASIGFATLGWIVLLLGRLFLVESEQELLTPFNFGRFFLYFLLFEAFAVQLWAFGLLFRGLADWRGPLTAAITGGVLFGAVSSQFFDEAFLDTITSLLYFTVWGIFYGLIRLRTSSLLGTTLVQAFQSLTTWHILLPEAQPDVAQLHNLYLLASTLYLLFIWRLWPHEEDDYRV